MGTPALVWEGLIPYLDPPPATRGLKNFLLLKLLSCITGQQSPEGASWTANLSLALLMERAQFNELVRFCLIFTGEVFGQQQLPRRAMFL